MKSKLEIFDAVSCTLHHCLNCDFSHPIVCQFQVPPAEQVHSSSMLWLCHQHLLVTASVSSPIPFMNYPASSLKLFNSHLSERVQPNPPLQGSVSCECVEHIFMVSPAHGASPALERSLDLGTKAPESSVEQKDLLSASALEHHNGINILEGSPAVARECWREREVGW